MRENKYQPTVIQRLKEEFKGCEVYKNDPNYIQGFPDLTVLYKDRWALLECKKSKNEPHQPNQDHYVEKLNSASMASFIYPENEDEVFSKLHKHFDG